jgi:hypothetical protein
VIKKVNKEFDRQIDHTSGLRCGKNEFDTQKNLKILSTLSMIEVNMNLASAYLP